MNRYGRGGWFRESHRHSLAARGVVTNKYMAKKEMPTLKASDELKAITSVEKSFGALRRVEPQIEQEVESKRPVSKDIKQIEKGAGVDITRGLISKREKVVAARKESLKGMSFMDRFKAGVHKDVPALNPRDKADLLAISKKAIEDANRGVPVDEDVKALLKSYKAMPEAKQALQQLRTAEAAERREREGFVAKEFREAEEATLVKAVGLPRETAEAAARGTAATGGLLADIEGKGLKAAGAGYREFKAADGGPGLDSKIGDLGGTSFVGTNVAIGNEEAGLLRPLSEPLPPLSSGFDEALKVSQNNRATNLLFKKRETSFADRVDVQVRQLDQSKDDLAGVNLESFKLGTQAFESGDREGLINAISNLKREEDKIANRWSLVEQTKKEVTSVNNHKALFSDEKSDNLVFQSGSGGKRMANQTEKLENVFSALKDSNDKLFSRRRMLQFRLQRMDANILPEQGAPDFDEIKRFSGDEDMSGKFDGDVPSLLTKGNIGLDIFK